MNGHRSSTLLSLNRFVILSERYVSIVFFLQNIELKVEVESLKKELVDKQELLKKAWYVILQLLLIVTYYTRMQAIWIFFWLF